MSRTGRPTKLTAEIQQKIVTAIAAGNYIETSAALVGINRTTLQRWMKRGARAQSGKHADFCSAVHKALAQAEVRDVAIIGQAAVKQWQAAAWRLERKNHKRWGRKAVIVANHEVSGPSGGAIQMLTAHMTLAERRAVLREVDGET